MVFRLGLFFLMGLVGIFSWPAAASAKLRVVATLPSFADIASTVGGDEVEAVSLTRGTRDPHFVATKPDLVLVLKSADLLLYAGLGFEDGWLPSFLISSPNGKIRSGADGNFDVSSVMKLKDVAKPEHSIGDVHPGGNPHYMLDPRNGPVLAKALAERFGKLLPEKAGEFSKRAEVFSALIAQRVSVWEGALKKFKGLPVVTYHQSLFYFSEWIGLSEQGYVEQKPGIPPSPEHAVRLIGLMKEKRVKLLLIESHSPSGTAEHIAREAGATVIVLPTEVGGTVEAKSYIAVFDDITARLGQLR
jgi:zinc/manganese transport system substrate-binding protein